VIGEQFSANGKGPITIAHLLLHRGGLRPDPNPNYCTTTLLARSTRSSAHALMAVTAPLGRRRTNLLVP